MGPELAFGEGQTPIAEEERRGLKLPLLTQRQLDEAEQLNIEQALLWLLGKQLTPEDILSEDFIRNLHRRMFKNVWKWAGDFRRTEKNIGVSWVRIPRELRVLCDDARYWVAHDVYDRREAALRFKHRLVSIHCFPNGNGRHSRMMADALAENAFGQPAFSWGAGLTAAGEARRRYINALRNADGGDMQALIDFA